MLELTNEQVEGLARIDARGYVTRVRDDLVAESPALASDATLPSRLWTAYLAGRHLGIQSDENVAAFLRIEAYAPSFYEKPAARAWITRPGRSADERFHDFLRVMKWRIEHLHDNGGTRNGGAGGAGDRSGSRGTWSTLGAGWNRLVGRGSGGRDGESIG